MRRQLAYKQLWRSGQVLFVRQRTSSQRCVQVATAKNRLSESKLPDAV